MKITARRPLFPALPVQRLQAIDGWFSALPPNQKGRVLLWTQDAELPVLFVSGANPGSCLVVTAAVHGDEFEGVRAIFEVFEMLDPAQMKGLLLAVPVANLAAFHSATRRSPQDGADLARSFPGAMSGTPTERIAALLSEHVIAHANLFLDLHSGGILYEMPSMAGCDATDPQSITAAEAFGADVLWMHDEISPGRTISYAASLNIPWLYTEAAGAGRIAQNDLDMMKRGILNLLQHLHILKKDAGATRVPAPLRLRGAGNTDSGIEAGADGLLAVHVNLLEDVREGDLLGVLLDEFGQVIETYKANGNGIVGLIHQFARVRSGETLFLLAERA